MSTAVIEPTDCVKIGEAVVFDEHEEFNSEGKVVRKFDRQRLESICRHNNQLIKDAGHFSPLGPGHNLIPGFDPETGDREVIPESMQPPIWGYAGNFRVGPHPKNPAKNCVIVDAFAKTTLEPDVPVE